MNTHTRKSIFDKGINALTGHSVLPKIHKVSFVNNPNKVIKIVKCLVACQYWQKLTNQVILNRDLYLIIILECTRCVPVSTVQ